MGRNVLACGALLAGLLLLSPALVRANDYQMMAQVVDCNNKPLVVPQATLKVQLSGCVDDVNDNIKAKLVIKPTDGGGLTAFTMQNQDNDLDTEDVVQFCWNSAGRQCIFDVLGAPSGYVFDKYVLPKSPKSMVEDGCQCNVCGQSSKYSAECPAIVNYPTSCGVSVTSTPAVIVLKAKSCPTVPVVVPPSGGKDEDCDEYDKEKKDGKEKEKNGKEKEKNGKEKEKDGKEKEKGKSDDGKKQKKKDNEDRDDGKDSKGGKGKGKDEDCDEDDKKKSSKGKSDGKSDNDEKKKGDDSGKGKGKDRDDGKGKDKSDGGDKQKQGDDGDKDKECDDDGNTKDNKGKGDGGKKSDDGDSKKKLNTKGKFPV